MTETPPKASETFDLDSILVELGSFGNYVFTAGVVPHRCAIPECESSSNPKEHWISFSIPQKPYDETPESCSRFSTLAPSCTADSFNRSMVVACDELVFDTEEITISNEWNITCDENKWKLSIVGTINNIGQFICTSITGILSDRYGRRITLIAGLMFGGIFGILRALSPNYLTFVLFEFMDTLFSAGTASVAFVLGMEFLPSKHRTIGGLTFSALYPVGGMIIALLAYLLQNWRYLLLALYVPALFTIFLYWMISESMRWLHTKSRIDEISEIIQAAAKMNNVQLSEKSLEMLKNPRKLDENASEEKRETLLSIFKYKRMFFIFVNSTFCMLVNTLVYTGLSLYAVHLGGNKYLNFTIVNLIELPSHVLAYFLLEKAGRRYSMSSTMILAGIFCFTTEMLPVGKKLLFGPIQQTY
ncbi:solute carrier family 22 member 4-like [Culicoides brevitarsis]|uniref:solute carrier family 22 member 4-like n=1 Tax=Culicoides brevitarsis TaxID=469753 RepID=UPI00307C9B9C